MHGYFGISNLGFFPGWKTRHERS